MSSVAVTRRLKRIRTREQSLRFLLGRLVWACGLLIAGGLAAVFSTTVFLRIAQGRSPYQDLLQHFAFICVGAVAILLMSVLFRRFSHIRRWLKYVIPVTFFISLILVALVKFSPLGVTVLGATRGLNLGFVTFQPSELLKISLVLYLAQLLCWWRKPATHADPDRGGSDSSTAFDQTDRENLSHKLKLFRQGRPVWPELPKRCMIIVALALGLTAIQPDLGSTGIILGSSLITIALAGVNWRQLLGFVALLVAAFVLLMAINPDHYRYAAKRIHTWAHPTTSTDGAAYQITQSRGAIAEGGFWGRGYLKSDQKMNRLPLSTKDFVYPVMVEELGFVGGLVIILLFVNLALVGLRISQKLKDPFNQTVVAALGFTICLQGLVNIATTIGTLPLSGLTLPFFSEGGTSLIVSVFAVGIMGALTLSEIYQEQQSRAAATD